MLVQIKQVRLLADGKPGTNIDLTKKGGPKRILEFRPLDPKKPDQEHVCDVTDQEELAQLLAIKEGFQIHASQLTSKPTAKPAVQEPSAPVASGAAKADDGGAPATGASAAGELAKDQLIDAVHKATGKKPHPSTSVKKLREMLEAAAKKQQ